MCRDPSRNCNSFKTKTTYSIILVPESAKKNTYVEKTFNVTNISIARTAGLHKLILVRQGGPEI